MTDNPKVVTCFWYDGHAEEAAQFYVSLIPDSQITRRVTAGADQPCVMVEFHLAGTPYQALNGGPQYQPNEAASISVTTHDQDETDELWNKLTADGGKEGSCGWLKDRFGVSWQIVPRVLTDLITHEDQIAAGRAVQAMFGMKKIVIAELEAAFNGDAAG